MSSMYPPNNLQNVAKNISKMFLTHVQKWCSNVPNMLFTHLPCTFNVLKMSSMFTQYTHWTYGRNIFRTSVATMLNVIGDFMLDTCWGYISDVPQMWLVDTLGEKWSRACNIPKMFPLVSRTPCPQCLGVWCLHFWVFSACCSVSVTLVLVCSSFLCSTSLLLNIVEFPSFSLLFSLLVSSSLPDLVY